MTGDDAAYFLETFAEEFEIDSTGIEFPKCSSRAREPVRGADAEGRDELSAAGPERPRVLDLMLQGGSSWPSSPLAAAGQSGENQRRPIPPIPPCERLHLTVSYRRLYTIRSDRWYTATFEMRHLNAQRIPTNDVYVTHLAYMSCAITSWYSGMTPFAYPSRFRYNPDGIEPV